MYYLITKEQADLIGVIQYNKDKKFDPYVVFSNNKYYVAKEMIDLLGELVSVINWNEVQTSESIATINKPDFTTK